MVDFAIGKASHGDLLRVRPSWPQTPPLSTPADALSPHHRTGEKRAMDIPPDRTAYAGRISDANPMGTDGFEFVEFTGPDIAALEATFRAMGFTAVARHRSKQVTLWRQGDINFILNAEPESFAQAFQKVHGPSACSTSWTATAHAARSTRWTSCRSRAPRRTPWARA
jgi:hypothetical protein